MQFLPDIGISTKHSSSIKWIYMLFSPIYLCAYFTLVYAIFVHISWLENCIVKFDEVQFSKVSGSFCSRYCFRKWKLGPFAFTLNCISPLSLLGTVQALPLAGPALPPPWVLLLGWNILLNCENAPSGWTRTWETSIHIHKADWVSLGVRHCLSVQPTS